MQENNIISIGKLELYKNLNKDQLNAKFLELKYIIKGFFDISICQIINFINQFFHTLYLYTVQNFYTELIHYLVCIDQVLV
jgi:hypothetical protein